MEVRAILRHVRISPLKVRLVGEVVKGKAVEDGLKILKFIPKKSAQILLKLIKSAVANADQNHHLDVDTLVIKNVLADQGPSLKRFRARARGRGTRILKHSSHVTVVLQEKMA